MRVGIGRLPRPNLVNDTPPQACGRHNAPLTSHATAAFPILSRPRLLIESKFLAVDPFLLSQTPARSPCSNWPRFSPSDLPCDLRSQRILPETRQWSAELVV